MVVRRKKKVRKFRGKRSYGFGSHKKHRGGGSRGGRGKAGRHKHKWTYVVKYEPDYFGKRGFKPPLIKEVKSINLKRLDEMVELLLSQKKVKKVEGKIKIDLSELGFDKLLGSGKVTQPLIVEAKYFSKLAEQKLEEVGGKAIKK
jgi:large subunit ribosomal protein L15